MNILITGAQGFLGKNLVANLRNIAQGKNRTRPSLHIEEIFEYDLDTDPALLGEVLRPGRFRVPSGWGQPPPEQRGIHGRQLRLFLHPVGNPEAGGE